MDKHQLLCDLDISTSHLLRWLSNSNIEKLNLSFNDKGWSAAQIAEHLLMLEVIANIVLRGKTIATNRTPDERINLIKKAMSIVV
jgi:hypothetical protein